MHRSAAVPVSVHNLSDPVDILPGDFGLELDRHDGVGCPLFAAPVVQQFGNLFGICDNVGDHPGVREWASEPTTEYTKRCPPGRTPRDRPSSGRGRGGTYRLRRRRTSSAAGRRPPSTRRDTRPGPLPNILNRGCWRAVGPQGTRRPRGASGRQRTGWRWGTLATCHRCRREPGRPAHSSWVRSNSEGTVIFPVFTLRGAVVRTQRSWRPRCWVPAIKSAGTMFRSVRQHHRLDWRIWPPCTSSSAAPRSPPRSWRRGGAAGASIGASRGPRCSSSNNKHKIG